MDKDPYSENQERPVYPANVVVSTLPRYEPRNIDETRQRKDFEIILNQALDLSPENIPIDLFQIDTRLPYEYYPYIKSVLSIYPKGIDPVSEITVFNAIWGKIGIEQLPWSVSMKIKEHPGYIVHLSVPEEEFSNAVNYLSYAYNRDRVDSPFNHRRLKHTEERDPQNYTITHTFIDGGVTHKVILHLKNETQDLFIPQKEEILPSAEMPIIQPLPKRSVFDNPNEFYIDDFPSMEGDKREREEILRTFIETASSFLNLGSFKLEYDKKKIYTNNDLETFPKELEVGPLLISYTDKSQDYAGIKTFAGLIIARLKYAFSINSMTVFASNTNQKQIFNKHLKFKPKDGVEIKVILESEHNRRPPLTQLVYEIENLGENFDKVNEIISAATEEPLTETDPLRAYIKAHAIRNYTYIVYTNKGKKDESQKN